MDSPQGVKNTFAAAASTATTDTTSSSESPPVQESPFFNYVNNLSPIKPVKAAHVAHGFPGFSSPPLVFTSPHINSHREASLLRRTQYSQSPSVESYQNENVGKRYDHHDSKKSSSLLPNELVNDAQKDCDFKNYANTQSCSSSVCVDEYLADHVKVDCDNPVHSFEPEVKQSDEVPKSSVGGLNNLRESILTFEDKNVGGENVRMPVVSSEQMLQEERGVEQPHKEVPDLKSSLSLTLASQKQQFEESFAQGVRECEDYGENTDVTSNVSAENTVLNDYEVSQKHRGVRRRCLQFEEASSNTFRNSPSSPHAAKIVINSRAAPSSSESKSLHSSHVALNATSTKKQMVKLSQPITSLFLPRCSGNSPLAGSKRPGIGLHLNSIVNAVPLACATSTSMRLAEDCMSVQSMKPASTMNSHVQNIQGCSISSNALTEASAGNEDERPETSALIAATSTISESPTTMEPLYLLNHFENPATLHDKRKLSSEHAESFEELNQPSPRKKKKKSPSTSDGDGCKRCNCKKTKCLKLYCDCFAAGIYCAEPCACQGCFNRPEYEDTVLETRQQIESRNPLAFAPKIIQRLNMFPAHNGLQEEGNLTTPSSARHKRGCNCKKSMCLKKYCECYQANVGCSSGCRCEGCKNIYGRKEEYVATEHALSCDMVSSRVVEERFDGTFNHKLESVANNTDLPCPELYDLQNLSPITPSLQFTDHGKGAAKSRLLSGKYLLTPGSDVTVLSSGTKFTRSPRNSENNNVLLGTSKEVQDAGSFDWRMDYNNVGTMDQSSPICDTDGNVCNLTPLSDPPSSAKASSISSRTRDWNRYPQTQACHRSGHLLSGGSLRWRSSQITAATQLGETKYLECFDSDSRLYDILEDETPEVLKETAPPIKSVKVSSPNKKRISPPNVDMHDRSSSSGGLKSGIKYILKAVPSFPPLTPCIDSKSSGDKSEGN